MALSDVLDDDPLAVYLLNERTGSIAEDWSGNGRPGVHVANPIRLGCGSSYDGEEDDTELGDPALALPLTGGTWEAWLWMNSYDRYAVLRDHSGLPAGDSGWLLFADTSGSLGPLDFALYRVGGTEIITDVPHLEVKNQTWIHFAVTYDDVESRFFVRGELRWVGGGPDSAPSPGPGPTPVALPWHVGRNGEFVDAFNTMRAARVAFFDSKLPDARIAAHASGPAPCGAGFLVGAVAL